MNNTMDYIKVEVIGAESMGVRSMCTLVETPDCCFLLDPGCALGPRKGYEIPHPLEYRRLHAITDAIMDISRKASCFFISHFHHDHFKPRMADETYIHSNDDIVHAIYAGKTIYMKSSLHHIGKNQKSRARYFRQSMGKIASDYHDADFTRVAFGDTIVDFSYPVCHGEAGTRLGHVIMVRFQYKGECFVFAPDVQGPVVDETMKFILDVSPVDLLFIGGPPIYLCPGLDARIIESARINLGKLHERVKTIILDHHCCRSLDEFNRFVGSIATPSNAERGNLIMDAASYMGTQRDYLESGREELYAAHPPAEAFMAWASLSRDARNQQPPPV